MANCCATPAVVRSSTRSDFPPAPDSGDPAEVCDLPVVGGGPAELHAAVYGASEGFIKTTTLAEDTALGGQAGTSSRIENYLGFPAGLSGQELAARAALQAHKFGVRTKLGAKAVGLSSHRGTHQVRFEDGEVVTARSVIISPERAITACYWSASPSLREWVCITLRRRWRPRPALADQR